MPNADYELNSIKLLGASIFSTGSALVVVVVQLCFASSCPSISDVGLEKLLSLAVKEDLIARNGKFVGYGFSRCEPKQEQLSPFFSFAAAVSLF